MHLSVVFVCCLFLGLTRAGILDGLFGPGIGYCHDDGDCHGGCCMANYYTGTKHCEKYIQRMGHCHTSGIEIRSCGCDTGLYCEHTAKIPGIALEHSSGSSGDGYCIPGSKANMSTPAVAIEG